MWGRRHCLWLRPCPLEALRFKKYPTSNQVRGDTVFSAVSWLFANAEAAEDPIEHIIDTDAASNAPEGVGSGAQGFGA